MAEVSSVSHTVMLEMREEHSPQLPHLPGRLVVKELGHVLCPDGLIHVKTVSGRSGIYDPRRRSVQRKTRFRWTKSKSKPMEIRVARPQRSTLTTIVVTIPGFSHLPL